MTRRRWIADEVSGDRAFLLGNNAEHLSRVLRARVGQQFEIATPNGVRLGEIVEIQAGRVTFSTRELPDSISAQAATAKIHLYLAIFKFDRFEWAVEKCIELGVTTIAPVVTRRTDSHLVPASLKRVERWRRIAHEAAQQSRREAPAEISDPAKLELVIPKALGKRIVLSETERQARLPELMEDVTEASLAIGPEGGWTDSEMSLFQQNAWQSASLGPTILRAETAAIAALAIAQASI
jgi:16S rRNA (uracil1498-N3)-methyltransferase